MTEFVEILMARPLFGVCATLAAYGLAEALWQAMGRPALLNPVLVATVVLAGLLIGLDISYADYRRQAEPIHEMLALIVVLLAVPLNRQAPLLRVTGAPVLAALLAGSVVALGSATALPLVLLPDEATLATLAPKSATTAVAVEIADRLGGVAELTAVIVIATGVSGAALGPMVLARGGVTDPRAVGFALGVAAHAIGTARAFQISETAGAFATLGMILNALLTIVLAPVALAALG